MNGDNDGPGDKDQVEETPPDDVSGDDIDLLADGDVVVGAAKAEAKVDKMVARIDSTDTEEAARQREVREKLDALREQRDDKLGRTYNFNLDDEL